MRASPDLKNMLENIENKNRPKPVVLAVLDGWGLGEKNKGNAIANAKTPTMEKMEQYYPHLALQASGISVGLPWGEVGNSEVGHMTLGSGKVIYQNMPRITMSIQDGQFFKNTVFLKAIENAKIKGGAVHLMGLLGKGSVHSNADHLYALLQLMSREKVKNVFLHIFTDGRDSAPTSGAEAIKELQQKIDQLGIGKIATVCGRYFAMDRNNNWDRIKKAYDAIANSLGNKTTDPIQYLKDSYKNEIFDEYLEPAVVYSETDPAGNPIGSSVGEITDKDSVIFFNYREDRARQLTKAFSVPGFSKFPVKNLTDLFFSTMTQYEESLPVEVAYPPVEVKECLGKILSENKMRQLRIAETEKFAHVTYFFNGGAEEPFPMEDRIIVPSKDVSHFDEVPEMSALEITEKVLENLEKNIYDFILINFANTDIVGHTGNEKATIKAVESVDKYLGEIIKAVLSKGGCLLITADHGNAEEIINIHTGEKNTEHSANPVPFWYLTPSNHSEKPQEEKPPEVSGILSDVTPTILEIMGLEKSPDMTGESLLPMLK